MTPVGTAGLSPRERLLRLHWRFGWSLLVAAVPLHAAFGSQVDLMRDAVYAVVMLCGWLIARRHPRAGFAVFIAGLIPIAAWSVVQPSLGAPAGLEGFSGLATRAVLPIAAASIPLALRGVLAALAYTLLTGLVAFGGQFDAPVATASSLVVAVLLGGFLAWLLAQTDITHRALERSATLDPLTGLGNRRAFDSALDETLAHAARHELPATVLVLDIDGLKAVNDQEGHARGDELLRAFARALRARLRIEDRLFRLGGDEFAAIVCEAGPDTFRHLHERVRLAVADVRDAGFTRAGASAGLAAFLDDGTSPGELFRLADSRMYEQKRAGNRARVNA